MYTYLVAFDNNNFPFLVPDGGIVAVGVHQFPDKPFYISADLVLVVQHVRSVDLQQDALRQIGTFSYVVVVEQIQTTTTVRGVRFHVRPKVHGGQDRRGRPQTPLVEPSRLVLFVFVLCVLPCARLP